MTGSSRLGSPGKFWPDSLRPVHYIFAAVFLARLVLLIRFSSSPLLLPTGSDMHFYNEWAREVLHGHWTDHKAFYGLPLYPFLVALLYRIFGYSPFVPGFFQAGLGCRHGRSHLQDHGSGNYRRLDAKATEARELHRNRRSRRLVFLRPRPGLFGHPYADRRRGLRGLAFSVANRAKRRRAFEASLPRCRPPHRWNRNGCGHNSVS